MIAGRSLETETLQSIMKLMHSRIDYYSQVNIQVCKRNLTPDQITAVCIDLSLLHKIGLTQSYSQEALPHPHL